MLLLLIIREKSHYGDCVFLFIITLTFNQLSFLGIRLILCSKQFLLLETAFDAYMYD